MLRSVFITRKLTSHASWSSTMMTEDYSAHPWVQHIPTHPAQQYGLFSVRCRLWLPSVLECKQIYCRFWPNIGLLLWDSKMIKGMKEYSNSLASHSNNNVRFMVKKKKRIKIKAAEPEIVSPKLHNPECNSTTTWGKSVGLRIRFCATHSERKSFIQLLSHMR